MLNIWRSVKKCPRKGAALHQGGKKLIPPTRFRVRRFFKGFAQLHSYGDRDVSFNRRATALSQFGKFSEVNIAIFTEIRVCVVHNIAVSKVFVVLVAFKDIPSKGVSERAEQTAGDLCFAVQAVLRTAKCFFKNFFTSAVISFCAIEITSF